MFVYRPHVHGLKEVTTPDLILDEIGLSSAVQWQGRKPSIGAAWVLVAAHYGTLLSVGLLDGDTPWIIARTAWRLADVRLQDLEIEFGRTAAITGNASAPSRGHVRFTAAPLPSLEFSGSCEVSLHDRRLRRRLHHPLQFLETEK